MRLLKCLVFVFVALVFASAELEIPYSARRNYNFCKFIKGIFTVTQKALNDDTCMRQVRLQESKVCQRVRPMEKQKFVSILFIVLITVYNLLNSIRRDWSQQQYVIELLFSILGEGI